MRKILFISFLGLFLFSAFQASAALVPCGLPSNDPGTPWDDTQSCQLCHGFVLFKNLIDFIIILSFAIATLMLAVGGVMYAISAGNEGMLRQAKAILKSTVIGLIIMLTSWLLVGFVLQVMGVAGPAQINIDFGKWWQINCPAP